MLSRNPADGAANEGQGVRFELFPKGSDPSKLDARPVAIAHFEGKARLDPLFAQVPHRRSLKESYDLARPVATSVLDALQAAVGHCAVGSTNDASAVVDLRALSHDALRIEIETPRAYKESVDLFRIGHREIEANPDGIDFGGPMFEALAMSGMMTRDSALDTGSMIYRQGTDAVLANTDTAMAHIWLISAGNSREEQIRAGYDWVRLNLAATRLAVGVQPLSQALQEYPEMQGNYSKIHGLLAPDGGTLQMFARLGYGPVVGPSPRWPVEKKIVARLGETTSISRF